MELFYKNQTMNKLFLYLYFKKLYGIFAVLISNEHSLYLYALIHQIYLIYIL